MAAEPSPNRPLAAGLMVLGSEMAGFTVIGLVLDYALNTLPWITVSLTVIGLLVVFMHMMQYAKSFTKPGGKP
jgi:F0F1-type ATP synthase assembly protein I